MPSNITINPGGAGIRIDLKATDVEHEPVGCRGIHAVLRIRRSQRFASPERCLTQSGFDAFGQERWRPVRIGGEAGKQLFAQRVQP